MVFKDKITAADRAGKETPLEALARLTPEQRKGVLGVGKAEIYDAGKLKQGMIRAPLGAIKTRLDKAGNGATIVGMSPATIEATKPGGRHHGWYLRLQSLSDAELEKSARSFERQIARHEGWISDPSSKMPDFDGFHPQRKLALVDGWQQDIEKASISCATY
jgi:hypothetical protein